ncbi:DNA replication and repair protein RecO [Methylobacillus rhizosphaerae]|uniref:DNA repair protein RecO n=1 Tax=Methylobacillus rhizosphaerae TaxID=551994 RepID=A0A238YZ94_9PROT|nr:DNA repair protein RecO [Methylobacillus rhizosphaerae]SNR76322.1 DNA replication and repair protein RecO [Methylobacillus rhizosphaerae]
MAAPINRQDNQPVFVLHTYPFKETSLVVELFSREFGRIAAVAKGARRPRSVMRGMLQAFQPLQATWSGKAELKNLHSMEWNAGLMLLHGEALMCGFYLNELLLRLLPREDSHDVLFDYYHQTLRILAQGQVSPATTLRRFELRMLQELGYAVPLEHDAYSNLIQTGQQYIYMVEQGAQPVGQYMTEANGVQLMGKTLLDMVQDDYSDVLTQQQSKQLMRTLLAYYLGEKPLHTRQLLMDLQAL